MKRILTIFVVLFLALSFNAVADDGIGLSVGMEFGLGDIGRADGVILPYITVPVLIYENSFVDDSIDLYAELSYSLDFVENSDKLYHSLYFDFLFGYNFFFGTGSTISVNLENELDSIELDPVFNLTGIFTPAVKYNQGLDFGDLYAKIGVPLTYHDVGGITLGIDSTIGWNTPFGLGLDTVVYSEVYPNARYLGVCALVSFSPGPVYFELDLYIPGDVEAEGITMTPEFEYFLFGFTIYLSVEFAGIGIPDGTTVIKPALGFKYSF